MTIEKSMILNALQELFDHYDSGKRMDADMTAGEILRSALRRKNYTTLGNKSGVGEFVFECKDSALLRVLEEMVNDCKEGA